jgi:hypothetical protein
MDLLRYLNAGSDSCAPPPLPVSRGQAKRMIVQRSCLAWYHPKGGAPGWVCGRARQPDPLHSRGPRRVRLCSGAPLLSAPHTSPHRRDREAEEGGTAMRVRIVTVGVSGGRGLTRSPQLGWVKHPPTRDHRMLSSEPTPPPAESLWCTLVAWMMWSGFLSAPTTLAGHTPQTTTARVQTGRVDLGSARGVNSRKYSRPPRAGLCHHRVEGAGW